MAGKKELIMASALKLLEQHSYKEISVLDIVADSAVNRNTFYYHFKDLPDLIEQLVCRSIDRAFDGIQGSLLDRLKNQVDTLYAHRKIAMHVYSSAERAVFDKGLDKASSHLTERIFACCPEIQSRSEEEIKRAFAICKACCYGLVCEWLLSGLNEEGKELMYKICEDSIGFFK